jgi:adenylate cyclase
MGDSRQLDSGSHKSKLRSSALLGLQSIDVFKGLHVQTLRAIADQCKWTRYRRNQYVIRRDGADKDVYFVIAGMVRLTADGWRGRRIILRDIPAGDLFGEHSAIDGHARVSDVQAVQESLLASMPPDAFRALLARHASVRERVLKRMSKSVRELADQVLDLGVKRVPGRIWNELLRLATQAGIQNNTARISHVPTHREIASHIGTSREQVARELSRLTREGLLAREGRALVVRDILALERLVGNARTTPPSLEAADATSTTSAVCFPRQRRAVLATETFDAIAMMERDEERTIQRWRRFLTLATSETIPVNGGRSFSRILEHGFVAEFPDSRQALHCAFQLTQVLAKINRESTSKPLRIQIGIHIADILVEDFNIAGDGVNIATGLAHMANPGEVIVSVEVRDQLTAGLDGAFEDLGEQRLRSRERSLRAFRVWSPSETRPLVVSAASHMHGRPSVAVIPFQVNSSDARFEFLGDGLADETIGALSRVADFFVVSRLSSMAFRRTSRSLRNIGDVLGVQYVLSGSIQTTNGQVVLVAELGDTGNQEVLWSERFSFDTVNGLTIQHELARKVVESVAPFVRSFELHRAGIRDLEQLDAYGLTLRGIDLMHRMSREDFLSAREVLQSAIARDPTSAAPHAWLAKWHVLRIAVGASEDPLRDGEAATVSARLALECDSKDALALAVDGHAAAWARQDLDGADRRLSEALSSNPNEPLAWLWKGILDAWRGRGAQAVQSTDHALSLSPLDPMTYYFNSLASTSNLIAAQYERAIAFAQQSLRGNRFHTPSLRSLAAAQVLSGRVDEARETMRNLLSVEPKLTVSIFRARYPGRDSPYCEIFAAALHAAGLPK